MARGQGGKSQGELKIAASIFFLSLLCIYLFFGGVFGKKKSSDQSQRCRILLARLAPGEGVTGEATLGAWPHSRPR